MKRGGFVAEGLYGNGGTEMLTVIAITSLSGTLFESAKGAYFSGSLFQRLVQSH